MSINTPVHDPLWRTGVETTSAIGVVIFDTGLKRSVQHVSCTLNGSAGIGDEFVEKWDIPDPAQPTMVRVRYFKAAGTAADTAVTFTWLAMGF